MKAIAKYAWALMVGVLLAVHGWHAWDSWDFWVWMIGFALVMEARDSMMSPN